MFNSCPVPEGTMCPSDLSLKYFEKFCTQYKLQQYGKYYLLKWKVLTVFFVCFFILINQSLQKDVMWGVTVNVPSPPTCSYLDFSYGHTYVLMKVFSWYILGCHCSFTWEISITSWFILTWLFTSAIYSEFSFLFYLHYVLKLTQHGHTSDYVVIWLSNISLWLLDRKSVV